jgi:hypothetical protein
LSAEFDDFVTAFYPITCSVEDPNTFTMAERCAIELMLDSLVSRNRHLIAVGETGRRPRSSRAHYQRNAADDCVRHQHCKRSVAAPA